MEIFISYGKMFVYRL